MIFDYEWYKREAITAVGLFLCFCVGRMDEEQCDSRGWQRRVLTAANNLHHLGSLYG